MVVICWLSTRAVFLIYAVLIVSVPLIIIIIVIIIITTLFQEDNIFGMNASLTYVLSYKG